MLASIVFSRLSLGGHEVHPILRLDAAVSATSSGTRGANERSDVRVLGRAQLEDDKSGGARCPATLRHDAGPRNFRAQLSEVVRYLGATRELVCSARWRPQTDLALDSQWMNGDGRC